MMMMRCPAELKANWLHSHGDQYDVSNALLVFHAEVWDVDKKRKCQFFDTLIRHARYIICHVEHVDKLSRSNTNAPFAGPALKRTSNFLTCIAFVSNVAPLHRPIIVLAYCMFFSSAVRKSSGAIASISGIDWNEIEPGYSIRDRASEGQEGTTNQTCNHDNWRHATLDIVPPWPKQIWMVWVMSPTG